MKRNNLTLLLLACILLLAAFLRLVVISRGDTLTDEVLYSFRAIGMLDFDEAADQTTPLEWFDPHTPWWTRLSFHDHPPLVFFIQHISLSVFGENRFGFRFPSALFGIASVYLLYLVGRELYSQRTGLIAAGLLALTVNHVYISRLGLQESYVIFFLLLGSYLFLKAQKNDTYYIWTGVALGFGFLTKYNVFILVPLCITYLALTNRKAFFNKKLWLGVILAVIIFSPVIIYNIELYRAVGHFDFQFSYIVGEHPKVWSVTPGKEIGTLKNRVRNFPQHLAEINSWSILFFFLIVLALFVKKTIHTPKETFIRHLFLIIAIFWLLLLFCLIGTSYRFISMLTPFITLSVAILLAHLLRTHTKSAIALCIVIGVGEMLYTTNSLITYYPVGSWPLAYSKVRNETFNWGFNELDEFITGELQNTMPAIAFTQKYSFIERIHDTALRLANEQKLPQKKEIIIYDGNINSLAQLWVLDRWQIYHAWPVIRTESYSEYLAANRIQSIQNDGFEKHIFIMPADTLPQKRPEKKTGAGAAFVKELERQKNSMREIRNARGDIAFRIYEF